MPCVDAPTNRAGGVGNTRRKKTKTKTRTYLQNRNRLTDIVVAKGGCGEGGKDWEFGITRCQVKKEQREKWGLF